MNKDNISDKVMDVVLDRSINLALERKYKLEDPEIFYLLRALTAMSVDFSAGLKEETHEQWIWIDNPEGLSIVFKFSLETGRLNEISVLPSEDDD